jgi:hypothetical protein
VAQSEGVTLHTGIVGDFASHCEFVMRRDIDIQVSNSHSDYFIKGKQAIRADIRCGFVVYRPKMFDGKTRVTEAELYHRKARFEELGEGGVSGRSHCSPYLQPSGEWVSGRSPSRRRRGG